MNDLKKPLIAAAICTALFAGYLYMPEGLFARNAPEEAQIEPGTKFVLTDVFRLIVPPKYKVEQGVGIVRISSSSEMQESPDFLISFLYDVENQPSEQLFHEDFTSVQETVFAGQVGKYGAKELADGAMHAGSFFSLDDRTLRIDLIAGNREFFEEAQKLLQTGFFFQNR